MKKPIDLIRSCKFKLRLILVVLVFTWSVHAQTFQVLHTFRAKADGAYPYSGLAIDGAGNLFGLTYTTGVGGYNRGTLYKIDSSGRFTVLRELTQHAGCLSF